MSECERCGGQGKYVGLRELEDPCEKCEGSGVCSWTLVESEYDILKPSDPDDDLECDVAVVDDFNPSTLRGAVNSMSEFQVSDLEERTEHLHDALTTLGSLRGVNHVTDIVVMSLPDSGGTGGLILSSGGVLHVIDSDEPCSPEGWIPVAVYANFTASDDRWDDFKDQLNDVWPDDMTMKIGWSAPDDKGVQKMVFDVEDREVTIGGTSHAMGIGTFDDT